MPDDSILPRLHTFIAETILEGHDAGLDSSTRLLELGILNSMGIVQLTAFIEKRFGIAVPMEMILAENFQTLETIAAMVSRLRSS